MLTYYCISSCDKCRKARKLLNDKSIPHKEINFRSDDFGASQIHQWIDAYGIDAILNTRSATWRGLDETTSEKISTQADEVILSNPAMLQRPILDFGDHLLTSKDALSWLENA